MSESSTKEPAGEQAEECLIDVHELAKELGVDPRWCYYAKSIDKIPSIKVGKYLRFRLSEVMAALEGDSDER